MASRSWNRVELIGNLTRDPELRYTPNGAAVCTFGLATNRTYVSEGEKKEEEEFHRLMAWNKMAELCNQLLKKGTKAFLSGRLQTRSWEGQDGATRTVTEIVVEDMIVLSPKQTGEAPITPPADSVEESKAAVSTPTRPSDGGKKEEKEEKVEKTEKAPETAPAEEVTHPSEEVKDDDLPF